MAIAEHFSSGITPQKGDTKRVLLAKRLNKLGGSALQSDTKRMLRGKIVRVLKGLPGTNTGF